MKNMKSKCYKSRYIVDVNIFQEHIQLVDSNGICYYVDPKNTTALDRFKHWFGDIFLKGINQHLVVMEVSSAEKDGEVYNVIEKFMNIQQPVV